MRLTNHIHLLGIDFQVEVNKDVKIQRTVNIYLIEKEFLYLIDAGTKNSYDTIAAYIKSIGRDISELKAVFLTHAHPDHMGGLRKLKTVTGCEVYVHKSEREWVENIDVQFSERPLPGFYDLVGGSVEVDHEVYDNQILKPEPGISLEVIESFGHSYGSVSYYFKEEVTLFTGDAVLLPGELPVYVDVEDFYYTIDRLKEVNANMLLSAFSQPLKGEAVNNGLEESKHYVEGIGEIVKRNRNDLCEDKELDFCKNIVQELGFSENIAHPLLLRSFMAHLN